MGRIHTTVPDGYRLQSRTKTVDINTAVETLITKKQRKYTAAYRHGQELTADLVSHVLVCPYCSHEIPAYAKFVNAVFEQQRFESDRIPNSTVEEWGSAQISIFEQPCTELYLNDVCNPKEWFYCPKCSRRSKPNSTNRDVIIERSKKTVKIMCEVTEFDELLSMQWLPGGQISVASPLYETVTFNFSRGHTFVGLEDASGNRIATRDITDKSDILKGGSTYRIITANVKISRILKRQFMKTIGSSLPFRDDELTLENLVLMTRFVGYDRPFYDAVPFLENSNRVDGSFKRVARNLHTKSMAKSYFERSSIPGFKSVRRVFFSKTGLLFYLPEGELLFEAIGDPNLFCKVLNSKPIYDILSELHQRPMISAFILDYSHIKGKAALVKTLVDEWYSAKHYGANYCSLSEAAKIAEQKTWHGKKHFYEDDKPKIHYSRPMCEPYGNIKDCVIDRFVFCWLRTSRDYITVAKTLDNCLSGWSDERNPVVCVRKNKLIVAAIEVQNNTVVQIQGIGNSSIGSVVGLSQAYEKWKSRYRLTEQEFTYDFDDDDGI